MQLIVEWENGKKDKLNFAPEKKEEIVTALRTPWVNLNLHNDETGEFWYMFHAKKATIQE